MSPAKKKQFIAAVRTHETIKPVKSILAEKEQPHKEFYKGCLEKSYKKIWLLRIEWILFDLEKIVK